MQAVNDTFNYLAVLFSIIIGLAATELLQGIRRLLIARRRVIPYWPSLVLAATLLLVLAQAWWAIFGLREHTDWTFGMYGTALLQIVLLYLVAALALPIVETEGEIDMRASHFAHAKPLYLLLVAAGVASVVRDLVINNKLPDTTNLAFHAAFIAIGLAASMSREEWFHKAATSVIFLAFVAYVGLLFNRMPG